MGSRFPLQRSLWLPLLCLTRYAAPTPPHNTPHLTLLTQRSYRVTESISDPKWMYGLSVPHCLWWCADIFLFMVWCFIPLTLSLTHPPHSRTTPNTTGPTPTETKKLILSGCYTMPYHVSSELRNLIDRMLDVDAATRITMEGVVRLCKPYKIFF